VSVTSPGNLRHGTAIIGTGHYVPRRVLTNDHLTQMVDTSDEWILARTGVRERRMAEDWENSGTMALEASRQALARAGVDPAQLDLIIVATCTPERALPSTACLLQQRLGVGHRTAAAFDVAAACSGFLYGTSIAHGLIQLGQCEHALVVGVDTLSRMTDYTQRNTAILFGDGAGAAVLKRTDLANNSIVYTRMCADGSHAPLIHVPGTLNPCCDREKPEKGTENFIRMDGPRVYRLAVTRLQELVEDVQNATGISPEQIQLLIPHQANQRIIEAVSEKTHFPKDRVYLNVDRYGNTSAASIPIAFDEALAEGRMREGDLVLLIAFGAGLTWSSALIRV
jgi:3-oxoacyl-[acyl-carrier-protein] synthase-3